MTTSKQVLVDICDVAYAMSLIGGKWKAPIVWELRGGARRLSELRRAMPGVSEGVLINQLKELCEAGILTRKDYQQVPPKVTYSLTPRGHDLLVTIQSLEKWGSKHRALTLS